MSHELQAMGLILREGFAAPDLAKLILRGSVGVFATMSGLNKLFVKSRHAALCSTLTRLGIPCVPFMQWWVPGWTFTAGIMLTLGLLSTFAAAVLLVIFLVAFWCEAHSKVQAYSPINGCDRVADYLYLPETLFIVLLVVTLLSGGAGAYSLDALWGAQ